MTPLGQKLDKESENFGRKCKNESISSLKMVKTGSKNPRFCSRMTQNDTITIQGTYYKLLQPILPVSDVNYQKIITFKIFLKKILLRSSRNAWNHEKQNKVMPAHENAWETGQLLQLYWKLLQICTGID